MSAGKKILSGPGPSRAASASRRPTVFAELSLVRVDVDTPTSTGQSMPAGSIGTIVGVWKPGVAYEVEFASLGGELATVEAKHLSPA